MSAETEVHQKMRDEGTLPELPKSRGLLRLVRRRQLDLYRQGAGGKCVGAGAAAIRSLPRARISAIVGA